MSTMSTMSTKKLGLIAAILLALIAGRAAPAGANNMSATVESGTITTVLGNFDLTPGSQGTSPCPEKADNLRFTTSANPNRWTVTGTWSMHFQLPPASGNWYQLDFITLNGSGGNWSGAAPTQPMTGVIGVQIRVYQLQLAGQPPTCNKNNLRCIITGVYTLAATSTYKAGPGNPNGLPNTVGGPLPPTPPPPFDSADHATIDSTSGPIINSSCTAPWNITGGTTATTTNFQIHLLGP